MLYDGPHKKKLNVRDILSECIRENTVSIPCDSRLIMWLFGESL